MACESLTSCVCSPAPRRRATGAGQAERNPLVSASRLTCPQGFGDDGGVFVALLTRDEALVAVPVVERGPGVLVELESGRRVELVDLVTVFRVDVDAPALQSVA